MRTGEKIYWCKRKQTPIGIEEFDSPEEITVRPKYFTVQPTSGYTATQIFGSKITSYQTAICQPYPVWKDKFSEGDLFWLDGKTPTGEEFNGDTANYIVDKVFYQNEALRLFLKRRS